MLMKNAFEILGATPNDNSERLQELYEEQQLFADDTTEIETAYSELANPKKRIAHEIAYFADESLSNYISLVTNEFEERPNVSETAEIIVNVGLFFEEAQDELFEQIIDARLVSGFPSIDESDLSNRIETLNNEYVVLGATYFDSISEKSLVSIFNAIVKIRDYQSFFIDDLIEHYKIKIADTLQEKENKCRATFEEIIRLCDRFNTDGVVSSTKEKANQLVKELNEWDSFAQPLQVNTQYHGAEDEESSDLARYIRNKIIGIVNDLQENAGKELDLISRGANIPGVGAYVIDRLEKKLNGGMYIIDSLMIIVKALRPIFSELDVTAERLEDDVSELSKIRKSFSDLSSQIESAKRTAAQRTPTYRSSGGCYVATCVYGSYDCPQVWTLRRYRDNKLAKTWYGRAFIRLYYAISPTLVKWFGKTKWFKKMWKGKLDRMVKKLENEGFENTPYDDKEW